MTIGWSIDREIRFDGVKNAGLHSRFGCLPIRGNLKRVFDFPASILFFMADSIR